MQFHNLDKFEKPLFIGMVRVSLLCVLVPLFIYMYLGGFSRHISDDFCEAVLVNASSPLQAVIDRYSEGEWRAANRYSNLLFVGFSEWLGPDNIQIVTPLMILLWIIGLVWAIHEIRRFARIAWPVEIDVYLGLSLAFLTLFQAPQLFQTVYWRSSMFTHFAPLVFGVLFLAFVIRQMRQLEAQPVGFWKHVIVGLVSFVIAGFSEPPVALMVTVLSLAIPMVMFYSPEMNRSDQLKLLVSSFSGAFLGLLVMVFSPANLNMVDSTPSFMEWLRDTFLFAFIFMRSTFQTLPLPSMISLLIPALLAWFYSNSIDVLTIVQKRRVLLAALIIPLITYLLIAASFSPSVYGQGFPVERMRFSARWLLTLCLMLEGGIFGMLLPRLHSLPYRHVVQTAMAGVFLLVAGVYPVRAARSVSQQVPEYRERAVMWDLRDAYIRRHAAAGEMDIIVPGYSGVEGVKELDDDSAHWVNVCASQYYFVNSIRSVSIPDEYILGYLSE